MRKGNQLTVCAYCGTPVYRWVFQMRNHPRHFCGNVCKGKWMSLHLIANKAANWKGGSYSTIARQLCNSRYRRLRKLVIAMDNGKCIRCNSTHRLEVHHILEKGKNPALIWDITNMITLCKKCHCSIRGNESIFVGFFNDIVEKRMNSGNSRTDNPEPSAQSAKVQRLLGHSDMLNNQISVLHESDDIVQSQ